MEETLLWGTVGKRSLYKKEYRKLHSWIILEIKMLKVRMETNNEVEGQAFAG